MIAVPDSEFNMKVRQLAVSRPTIKNSSGAIWWIKNPKKTAHNFTQNEGVLDELCRDFKSLISRISLHGVAMLLSKNPLERIIWLLVQILSITVLTMATVSMWPSFTNVSIQALIYDSVYPSEKIPFPSFTICPHATMSLSKVEKFARELSALDPENRTVEFFMKATSDFRRFYTGREEQIDTRELTRFQYFLDQNYNANYGRKFFHTRKVLEELSPSCEDFIKSCIIGDDPVDCFTPKTFKPLLTYEGMCCTFNAYDSYKDRTDKYGYNRFGYNVILELEYNESDTFYSKLDVDGYTLKVHRPFSIPSPLGIDFITFHPNHYRLWAIDLEATEEITEESLRSIKPSERFCYYADEKPPFKQLIDGVYSSSNCLLDCLIKNIKAICDCLPFYVPYAMPDDSIHHYCTFYDIYCLNSRAFKFYTVLINEEAHQYSDELALEMADAMICTECFPACEKIKYNAGVAFQGHKKQ